MRELADTSGRFWRYPPGAEDPVPRHNIAPRQTARVIRGGDEGVELAEMRWGFTRFEGDRPAGEVINARSETATDVPMFRRAMGERRCLVPASGFYEWEKRGDGCKQPWYLTDGHAPLFFMGGLWEDTPDGAVFVVLTCPTPAGFDPPVHYRMPAVITADHAAGWLAKGTSARDAAAFVRAFGAPGTFGVRAHPVSTRVNAPRHDDVGLTDPVAPEQGLFAGF